VTAAIFGLVGVVIGAVVPAAMQYVMQRADRRSAVRANVRLLTADLQQVRGILHARLTEAPWLPTEPWADKLPGEGWQERLELLARELPAAQWDALEQACAQVARLRDVAAGWSAESARNTRYARELATSVEVVDVALVTLRQPGGAKPAPRRALLSRLRRRGGVEAATGEPPRAPAGRST